MKSSNQPFKTTAEKSTNFFLVTLETLHMLLRKNRSIQHQPSLILSH
jgi:hypothetical protein